MFRVPFTCAMSDADVALLASELDLTTHMHPKLLVSPVHPAFKRTDFSSGLFLEHGASEGHWVLEGRTWGNPPAWLVHDWHLRAAGAARRLDPAVTLPSRLSASTLADRTAPLGRDANKRLIRLVSHLLGSR
ncbi:MAG: hypothetical protein ACRDJX_02690 [Solirubrobacteraceae bacterium]